jgi:hypothetical protein
MEFVVQEDSKEIMKFRLATRAENHGKSRKILIKPMPFPLPKLCLMPFGRTMPFSEKLPTHHDGGLKKV